MKKELSELTNEDAYHIARIALFIDKDEGASLIKVEDMETSIPRKRVVVYNPQVDEQETIMIDGTFDVWEEERIAGPIPISNQVEVFKYLQEKGYI